MAALGTYVIYLIMACLILGAFAALRNDQEGLGKEFVEGLHSIGPIFIPVAGIMAAVPYLSQAITFTFGPMFAKIGADPAIAGTTIIAMDMGGYQLAKVLSESYEGWLMALIVGSMAGPTIVFSIPVGLVMLDKKDHKYMALGIMSGLLSVPIGVLFGSIFLMVTNPLVREAIAATGDPTLLLDLNLGMILSNLAPLTIFCVGLVIGLKMIPDIMIRGFLGFAKIMHVCIVLVLAFSIVEYFTGAFSTILGSWGFDPIIADEEDQFRALEVAGYIGIMLAGAFPMVYLIKKYLAKPMEKVGNLFGMHSTGAAGILAGAANILAMFRLIGDMPAKDKVLCISFAVCAAFMFGDHLAFIANFQPSMIPTILFGKLIGGICGFFLAMWLSVPKAQQLEKEEK
ncbi:MAG: ethanolamine utilization protein EutH [Candidatus Adiutrix sp.]